MHESFGLGLGPPNARRESSHCWQGQELPVLSPLLSGAPTGGWGRRQGGGTQQVQMVDTDISPQATKARRAQFLPGPGPRRGRGQCGGPPWALSLFWAAQVLGWGGPGCPRSKAAAAAARGFSCARRALLRRCSRPAPHPGPGSAPRQAQGVRSHLHRPSEEDARVGRQLLHVEVHGAPDGWPRPARAQPGSPRPPTARTPPT